MVKVKHLALGLSVAFNLYAAVNLVSSYSHYMKYINGLKLIKLHRDIDTTYKLIEERNNY